MRTTLTIEDDILAAAKYLAQARNASVGAVLSELARKGLNASRQIRHKKGFPVFHVRPDAKPITLEDIQRAEDET